MRISTTTNSLYQSTQNKSEETIKNGNELVLPQSIIDLLSRFLAQRMREYYTTNEQQNKNDS